MSRCIFFLAVFLSSFFAFADAVQKPPEFVVVIPSYNNGRNNSYRCIANLESVICQTYPYYSVIYIEDCSTDDTAVVVDKFVKDHHLANKIKVIHNKERQGQLYNTYHAIHSVDPDKIIIIVDGDDALANDKVIDFFAKIYTDKTIWITFGNCRVIPGGFVFSTAPVPEEMVRNHQLRAYLNCWIHPRTFYAKLFHQIKKEDLLQSDGKFYKCGTDRAYMAPMLEMATPGHFKKIPEVLYLYYDANPLNTYRTNRAQLMKNNDEIRAKPPYQPLKTLFPEVTR
jgi:glycosyltransferase involved in cell wall biosynthesis